MAIKFNCSLCDKPIILSFLKAPGKILCPHCAEETIIPEEVEDTSEAPNVAGVIERKYALTSRQQRRFAPREYLIELIIVILVYLAYRFLYSNHYLAGILIFIIIALFIRRANSGQKNKSAKKASANN